MVGTRVGVNLRMRKQNTSGRGARAWRIRPVGRFCELRFRDLSSPTGREGGREGGRDKSAPRPYETDPIHPLSSNYR